MGQPSPTGKDIQGMKKCGHQHAYISGMMSKHHSVMNDAQKEWFWEPGTICKIGMISHPGQNGKSDIRHKKNRHDGHDMDGKMKNFPR